MKAGRGPEKYMVCNADEGDPGAFMDRSMLEGDPHSIIEGMLLGGYAIGASQGYVYVRAEYPLAVERLEQRHCIRRGRRGCLGAEHLWAPDFSFDLEIRIGARRVRLRRGDRASGLRGGPTRRAAAEAALPRLSRACSNAPPSSTTWKPWPTLPAILLQRRAVVPAASARKRAPAPRYSPCAGKINNAGLVEVPMGIPLGEILYTIGGGITGGKSFKAIQSGGPSGGCLTRGTSQHARGLRVPGQAGRHHGIRRPDRHGRGHLHGGYRPLLHGLYPR